MEPSPCIAQLEAQVRKLKRCKADTAPAVYDCSPGEPAPLSWKPPHRLGRKTSMSQELSVDVPIVSDTLVWHVLESVFHMPPDILTALYAGLAQFYTLQSALQLFQEAWLRDLTDRWVPFAALI